MNSPASTSGRDEHLAKLLAELTEQFRCQRSADVEAIIKRHPDLADELRQLWATVQLAEELARPSPLQQITTSQAELSSEARQPSAPSSALLPRTVGDYELLEELGRGGMGVVYKACQLSLKRIVALKMVLRGDLAAAVDLHRLRAEAESAARLEHPNIVPVYEVGECPGQAYFSMKYVEGTTLAGLLARGPLPPREAAQYLAAICRAVHYAHQHGILHRDLKPTNVLIDRDGRPLVTDFGLAKRVEGGASLTRSGAIVGTPSYMAPEQAAGSRGVLGPASDIYSLGTILYEMLTGRPPFQAPSPVDTLMLVLEQDPVPPRLLNPGVDRQLETICLKCLQKPAALRYQTAAQLADDLEAFVQGETPSVGPGGLSYLVSRLLRETHHAAVLENWGMLWMWHSLQIFLLCLITNVMLWGGIQSHGPYLALWSVGLIAWGAIFWALRRRGGPVMFIERQIAHVWAAGVVASIATFVVEVLLVQYGIPLPVLALSPFLAVIAGMVFLIKAGMLSGAFYFPAAALFLTAVPMVLFPQVGPLLFGIVSAACFFFPGLKYHRQRVRAADST